MIRCLSGGTLTRTLGFLALLTAAPADAADPPPLEKVQIIPLAGEPGKFDHLALDAKRDRLLLAHKANNTLEVVDLKAGRLLRQIADQGGISGLVWAADADRIFAGLSAKKCNVFDAESGRLLQSIAFSDEADNVCYDPRTRHVFVGREASASVLDAPTGEAVAEVKLPGSAQVFALDPGRPRIFVNVAEPAQVVVIDTDKNAVVNSFPVTKAGDCHPLGLDAAGRRLFVGCRKNPALVVLDADTGREVAAVPIPGVVDDVFFDA
jgi:hypothetical protein